MGETKFCSGASVDVGTMFLASARKLVEGGKVETAKIRNAFLDLPSDAKNMLKLSKVNSIDRGDNIYIIGDEALAVANIFHRDIRRPLCRGIISSQEVDAFDILSLIIEKLLGKPVTEKEICHFSVPAVPIDNPGQDVIYHTGVFHNIISKLGYTAKPMNEALAICYAECAKEMFSGLTLSFGAGMVNCALTYRTIPAFQFSLARSGDWIDAGAARSVGSTATKIAAIKERGVNLLNPREGEAKTFREREAICFYYEDLIKYTISCIEKEFLKIQNLVELPESIPLVIAGGTTMAGGFLQKFQQLLSAKKDFPFNVGEIRQAENSLLSVAKGLLVASLNN